MIEIKAFVYRNTEADVVHALGRARYKNLPVRCSLIQGEKCG